jgi:hypothetical protein
MLSLAEEWCASNDLPSEAGLDFKLREIAAVR